MFRGLSLKTLLAVIAVVAGLALAAACGSNSYSSPTGSTGSTGATPAPTTSADVTITITGMNGSNSYSPNPAAVKVGQTVAWKNGDAIAHTATGAGFDTGSIAAGATSAPMKFSTAGAINYHCSFHPSMTGTLNVQ